MGLEGGCLRVHLKAGDCLAMPARYLHMVLTKGDTVAFGTNFLAFGHLPLVLDELSKEFTQVSETERFPGLEDLLALFVHTCAVKTSIPIGHLLQDLAFRVCDMYSTERIQQVSNLSVLFKFRLTSVGSKIELSF